MRELRNSPSTPEGLAKEIESFISAAKENGWVICMRTGIWVCSRCMNRSDRERAWGGPDADEEDEEEEAQRLRNYPGWVPIGCNCTSCCDSRAVRTGQFPTETVV